METDQNKFLKTGTTTIGIVCKDGIVIGADKRATAGNLIVDAQAEKVHDIGNEMAITIAGMVSDAQLLTKLIKAEIKIKDMRTLRKTTVKEASNLLAGIVYGNIRRMSMVPGVTHFLLGGKDNTGYHLYDIFPDGSITHIDKFIASGSGSVIAYGVLETQWKPNLSIDEGMKLLAKSVNAAIQRDSASGNGLDIVTIDAKGLRFAVRKQTKVSVEL
ncbi:MAG: proteasome subunit beta [DPANN group archaeon]|nr:proteasome subunit beta [DPANN group archaeon]